MHGFMRFIYTIGVQEAEVQWLNDHPLLCRALSDGSIGERGLRY